jgi:hypothetical protein
MDGFSARGIDNPAKAVTSKGFREYLVKGIIEDDLPYSLGEKAGMSKLFEYVLPRGITTPSHQTVRRDLDILYEKLDEKLNKELKVSALCTCSRGGLGGRGRGRGRTSYWSSKTQTEDTFKR